MKKIFAIFFLACFAVMQAAAYEWTDGNGVKWYFSNFSFTINGERQPLWYIYEAEGYSQDVTVPSTVYNGTTACTVEAIDGGSVGIFPNGSNITLPNTIKYISGLLPSYTGTVKINATTPPTYDTNFGLGSGVTVLVPAASLEAYRAAEGWNGMMSRIISQDAMTTYSVNVTAQDGESDLVPKIGLDNLDNVMSLTVKGTINSRDILMIRNKLPNLHHLDLTNATIVANSYPYYENYTSENDVLGDCAFSGMTKLLSVKLPKSIKSIGEGAFRYCYGLQNVEFQEGLQSIGNSAFYLCSNLTSVTFPQTLQSIGEDAFYNCSNLTSVTFPQTMQSIGNSAFGICSNLTSVTFPQTMQSIGYSAFSGCSNLTSVVLPEGITTIEEGTFSGCVKLQSVSLPSSLTDIQGNNSTYRGTFSNCTSLTSISFPTNLETIGAYSFKGCTSLTEVRLPSMLKSIGDYAFSGCTNLKEYYVYTVEPVSIGENTFSNWKDNATLHIPSLSFWNYYYNTQWSQFHTLVQDNNYQYDAFYLSNDFIFNETTGTTTSSAEVQLYGGSGMKVETSSPVVLSTIHFMANDNASASIIANGNLQAQKVSMEMVVQKNKWYFFSVPFRVKVSDITTPGRYVLYYYDGQKRATNGQGGWQRYTGTYLQPGQGYIFQSEDDGTLTMPATASLDFSGGERQDQLATYVSSKTQNASWNFLGNPHSSYYDIDDTGYEAPITVWNGSSYQAVRAGDDQYHLSPLQSFFVQKPSDVEQVSFPASGRHTYLEWSKRVEAKQNASRQRLANGQRHLINLTIGSDEDAADQTRVVFNAAKSLDYELDCDAAKFMSDQPVPQLYTLGNEGTRYAINERPMGEVNLGYVAPTAGELTISAPRMDCAVLLRDNLLGITHDLSLGGYTFTTEAGTFEGRFTLVASAITVIEQPEEPTAQTRTVYTLGGTRLAADSQQAGAYIVREGNMTKKVLKK